MKLYNGDVLLFAKTIINIALKGKKQRLRTRLYQQLVDYHNSVIEKDRLQLIDEYANRDENGEIIFNDQEKRYPSLKDEFYRELDELYREFYVIENNESNRDILLNICDILLDDECELEISGEDLAIVFESWCQELETTQEFYNQQIESE